MFIFTKIVLYYTCLFTTCFSYITHIQHLFELLIKNLECVLDLVSVLIPN